MIKSVSLIQKENKEAIKTDKEIEIYKTMTIEESKPVTKDEGELVSIENNV